MDNKGLKIIKNVAICFFVLIFVLGFFSKSIISLFLPKVQVTLATKGSYSRTLNIDGTIEPKETAKIRLGRDTIVDEFYVKQGDSIKAGKPVFKINRNLGIKSSGKSIDDLKLELEKQRIELEALSSSSNEIESKNIQLLEEKCNVKIQEVEKLKVLYDNGAIPYSDIEQGEMELKADELNLEIMKLQIENEKSKNSIQIKEIQNNINKIEAEIREIREGQAFYSSIGEDGIYYSEYDGIVISTSKTEQILSKDTSIVEIALVDRFDTVMFNAVVPEDQYDVINSAKIIELNFDDKSMPEEVLISKISKLADDGVVEVEGEFSESKKKPILGQQVRGKLVKNFGLEGTIPKDAFIPYGEIEIGEEGTVFTVEEVKGVLGTEYFAREVPVTLVGVGDNRVSVTGLEGLQKPWVILNLSYKIKDGTKVFLWD